MKIYALCTIAGKRRVHRGEKSARFWGQKATKTKDFVVVSFAVAEMDTAVPTPVSITFFSPYTRRHIWSKNLFMKTRHIFVRMKITSASCYRYFL
jgi:hypothetical protein